jgi:uncharacterized protein HemY
MPKVLLAVGVVVATVSVMDMVMVVVEVEPRLLEVSYLSTLV